MTPLFLLAIARLVPALAGLAGCQAFVWAVRRFDEWQRRVK